MSDLSDNALNGLQDQAEGGTPRGEETAVRTAFATGGARGSGPTWSLRSSRPALVASLSGSPRRRLLRSPRCVSERLGASCCIRTSSIDLLSRAGVNCAQQRLTSRRPPPSLINTKGNLP